MASGRARTWLREVRPPPLLLLLLLLGPWQAAGHGGKYSREKNEPEPSSKREPGGEFRMEKLNQLWEKAQRVSGGRAPLPRGSAGPGLSLVSGVRGAGASFNPGIGGARAGVSSNPGVPGARVSSNFGSLP